MVTAEAGTSKGVIGSDTLNTLKYSALKSLAIQLDNQGKFYSIQVTMTYILMAFE